MLTHPRLSTAVLCLGAVHCQTTAMAIDPPGWELVFEDDFDAATLDPSKWRAEDAFLIKNNELQYYTPEDVLIQNGLLRLRSQQRFFRGQNYTSGLVETRDRFAQRYGRFEVTAKLPSTQGIWPAHWMLPQDGTWPPEIDIMELLGHEPTRVHQSVHWGVWPAVQTVTNSFVGPNFAQAPHTFTCQWYPDRIEWLVDGQLVFSQSSFVPDKPFYLILNTAVGGDWPGNPNGSTVFPQFHDIDSVRIYTFADPGTPHQTRRDLDDAVTTVDGNVAPGEYAHTFSGINSGFGDLIGAGSSIGIDSTADGWVRIGIDSASPWPDPSATLGVVIYVDSEHGGFTSTLPFKDNADLGRALASGRATATGTQSELYFAPGFTADYAIFIQQTFAGIYRLDPVSHQFVQGITLNGTADVFGGQNIAYRSSATDPSQRELAVRLEDLGMVPGQSFDFVATQLDGASAIRSNEYVGVAPGNPFDAVPSGVAPIQLKFSDFDRMTTVSACPADLTGSADPNSPAFGVPDAAVDASDFFYYLSAFTFGNKPVADLTGSIDPNSPAYGVPDGLLGVDDFFFYLTLFALGCP